MRQITCLATNLATSEHVGFGTLSVADLMDLSHGSESDETNQSIWRKKAKAHDYGILQCLKRIGC